MINNFLSSTIWLSSNTICLRKSGSKWNSFPVLFRVMKMYPSNLQRWPIDFVGFFSFEVSWTPGLFVIGLISIHCSDDSFWYSDYPISGFCVLWPHPWLASAPRMFHPALFLPQSGKQLLSKQGFLLVGTCLGNPSLSASESFLLLILSKYRAGKHGLFQEKKFILVLIFLIQVGYYTLFT